MHDDLLEDVLPAIVPAQRPRGRVPVHLARGVEIRQNVVRQHGETSTLAAVVVRHGNEVTAGRMRRGDNASGGEHDGGALVSSGGVRGAHLELEKVADILQGSAVRLGAANLLPRLRFVLARAVGLGAVVVIVEAAGAAVRGAVRSAVRGAVSMTGLILQVGRLPERLALVLVPPAVEYAVAHPLPPRLRETILTAVVRLAVHVLQHRGLAGVHAAHGCLPVRPAPVPSVAKVGASTGSVSGMSAVVDVPSALRVTTYGASSTLRGTRKGGGGGSATRSRARSRAGRGVLKENCRSGRARPPRGRMCARTQRLACRG